MPKKNSVIEDLSNPIPAESLPAESGMPMKETLMPAGPAGISLPMVDIQNLPEGIKEGDEVNLSIAGTVSKVGDTLEVNPTSVEYTEAVKATPGDMEANAIVEASKKRM